ncbi:hypothetical protein GCM10027186_03680 [Micromonospora schwarzwaldensis]
MLTRSVEEGPPLDTNLVGVIVTTARYVPGGLTAVTLTSPPPGAHPGRRAARLLSEGPRLYRRR